MARLDIAIGEEFPLEEKKSGEDCARGRHAHHHHGSLRERWRHHFSRSRDKTDLNKTDPNKTDKE